MLRPVMLFAAIMLAMAERPCCAQIRANPAMRGAMSLIQLEINSGKLQAKARQRGRTSSWSSSNPRRTERLAIRLTGNETRLHYMLSTPTQRVTMVVSSEFDFYARQDPLGDSKTLALNFKQEQEGPLSLAWGTGSDRRELEAPSLWHLCLREPEVCRKNLFPLLEVLRPDWELADTADQITEALANHALPEPIPWERWQALVAGLGSDVYAVRRAADRQLRSAGPAAGAFLESIDRSQLDAEQRFRIGLILKALDSRSDSTSPEAIASWLAADPQVWLALLSDSELARRKRAKAHLQRLVEEPIDFDPTAEPDIRQAQIEQLRAVIERVPSQEAKPLAE